MFNFDVTRAIIGGILGLMLCVLVIIFFFNFFMLVKVGNEISENGAKSVVERVWCGKEGCDESGH